MYQSTEENLHKAAQFIALCGKNFSENKPDDSHTTARWVPKDLAMESVPLTIKGDTYTLAVAVKEFELQFKKATSTVEHSIDLQNAKVAKVIAAIQQWSGVTKEQWESLHYDLPKGYFEPETVLNLPDDQALYDWIMNRNFANEGLERLNEILNKESPVLIWPHHFDTGTHYTYAMDGNTETRAIGAGLAIADGMVDEPYFYLYGHRSDGAIEYGNRPELSKGKWIISENWQGAVLPISALSQVDKALPVIERYFQEAGLFLAKAMQ